MGGVYLFNGAVLTHSIVTYNKAGHNGGGVLIRVASSLVNNSLIANNTAAKQGGAVIYSGSTGTIKNSTIVDNISLLAEGCGGVHFGENNGKLINNIVWGNSHTNYLFTDNPTFTHNCTWPLPEGENNIDSDPRFANPAGGNYRLSNGSPCIDAGLDEVWMVTGGDLDGKRRIRYGNVDIGAYEYQHNRTILLVR